MKDDLEVGCLIRFDCFEVNLTLGELRRDGVRIALPEQSFQVLAMLLERPGELVTRGAIQKRLWPNDTIVEFENSISAAIRRLRVALGDSAEEPRYIQTLPRRGYRWLSPVDRSVKPVLPRAEVSPQPSPARPPASNFIGMLVSHYRVLDILGGGGMGVVYRAEDVKLGRQVALKFLPDELADDPGSMLRFEREARTASALSHPGICTIYEIEEEAGRPFIAMELLKGQTLRELIEASGSDPLPIPKVLELGKQIVAALEAAHSHGIIHRDIKPANIYVTPQGQAKILDFGLAKSRAADTSEVQSLPSGRPQPPDPYVSHSGQAMGTAAYMSPEQVRGEKVDERTDIYSFGLVLYEMATGHRAFMGDSISRLHAAILEQEPVPVRTLNPTIPEALETVITTAMQKERTARYTSASGLLEALQSVKVGDVPVPEAVPQAIVSEKKKQRPRKVSAVLTSAAVVIVFIVAIVTYFVRQRQTMRLTNQDTIVLADFANSTGESIFDGTLKQATSIALRQSPFLNILSDREVRSILKSMTRPPTTSLSPDVAREVCQRAGSKAYIVGAIGSLASEYVLQLKAVNCVTGRTLAQQQITAESKDKVLDALSTAAAKLRGGLGESLATVSEFDVPLSHATTASLDALKAYSVAYALHREQGPPAALPQYLRAIQLDPNFAMAYLNVGICYFSMVETERANEYLTKAFQLREHGTEREKLSTASMYYYAATGELDNAAQVFQKLIEIYPRETAYYNYLGLVYAREGQYEKALETERRVYPLAGDALGFAAAMAKFALALQRVDEVRQIFHDLQTRKVDGGEARTIRYGLAFLTGDDRALDEQVEWFHKQSDESGLQLQADAEAYRGRLNTARQMTTQAAELASHHDDKESAGLSKAHAGMVEALFGDARQAQQSEAEALKIAPKAPGVEIEAALAFATLGDSSRSEHLSQDLARRFPLDTQVQSVWLPTIAAQSALSGRKAAAAITLLQAASSLELGYTPSTFNIISCLYTVHVRAEAYLEAGDGSAAANEFQKILDHKGIVLNCPTGALAHLGLGRANALQARKTQGATSDAARSRALTAYQNFFTLWRNADPDIPILKQAKAEYAHLQ